MPYKNKEDLRAYGRAYRAANKEKKIAYDIAYREANKDKEAARVKAYREANKEEVKEKAKAYRESLKEGFYSVYYLPEEHYAGVTSRVIARMRDHKCNGMITEGFEVVFTTESKREALDFEAKLHSMGYNGSDKNGYLARRIELNKSLKEAA